MSSKTPSEGDEHCDFIRRNFASQCAVQTFAFTVDTRMNKWVNAVKNWMDPTVII